jgi:transcriptional regulator with XRE-family HTH domain
MQSNVVIADRRKMMGALLRRARLNAGLDIDACAHAVGAAAEQFHAYETGEADVSLPQLEILSRLFGLPVTYFWNEDIAPVAGDAPLPTEVVLGVRRRMIGVLLRQARLAAGKRLGECADLLGAPSETVAAYEYGRQDIPFASLELLAGFLHVPVTYFADEELVSNSDRELHALELLNQLPPDTREFVLKPANVLYLRLAMLLSSLSTETLRHLGEGLLDITL